MELAIALGAAPLLVCAGFLLWAEFRAMWVEWRVRRGLRAVLAQEA